MVLLPPKVTFSSSVWSLTAVVHGRPDGPGQELPLEGVSLPVYQRPSHYLDYPPVPRLSLTVPLGRWCNGLYAMDPIPCPTSVSVDADRQIGNRRI